MDDSLCFLHDFWHGIVSPLHITPAGLSSGEGETGMSRKVKKQAIPAPEMATQGRFTRNLPWIVVGVMALWLVSKAFTVPKKSFQGMDMHGFGRLPVV